MSANRYFNSSSVPQPVRKILNAPTDINHVLKIGERIDNLAYKYYKDPTLSWIIMCANPEFHNEFDISFGTNLRIPFPLERVFTSWLIGNDI